MAFSLTAPVRVPATIAVFAAVRRWWFPAALVLLIAAFGVRRLVQLGDYPTGLDAGGWLGFGRAWFGDGHKAETTAYPPLVPSILHAVQLLTGPFSAARIVGIGSMLAVVAMVALAARALGLHPLLALCGAALVAMGGPMSDTIGFGGYPQNVALACMLGALFFALRYFPGGRRRHLVLLTLCLQGAALSHHMYFLVALSVLGGAWLAWASCRPGRGLLLSRTGGLAIAGALGIACFLPTYAALLSLGYSAPIGSTEMDLREAFRYPLRDAPWFWAAIVALGAVHLALRARTGRADARWQFPAALMTVPALVFLATAETRLLPVIVVGAILAALFAFDSLWRAAGERPWAGLLLALPVTATLLALPSADAWTDRYFRYYAVMNAELDSATTWVEANPTPGFVAVTDIRDGWPLGWWFEGLTDSRIAVGSELRWLAFPDERERARAANAFFEAPMDATDLRKHAEASGIDFLVVAKHEFSGWRGWVDDPIGPAIAFENREYVILDLRPDGMATNAPGSAGLP